MIPRATYRLQLHKNFTFADASRLVPYLAKLGISHLYASPILAARPGSPHGYDVIDPTRVNPELGGEEGLRDLVAALRGAELGLIVDIVPNHMYAGNGNGWWLDVLRRGPASAYAKFFDIDWSALGGKILLPILGTPYGEALDAGVLKRDGASIRYFDHVLPLAPETMADGGDLHALLERQHYRLAWWRIANDEINWRRFFDINDLVAVRVEDDDVFEAAHAVLLRLYAEGLIDGMRVDHVDGVADPGAYCRRLRARLAELERERPKSAPAPAYLVVEKILGRDEQLPLGWQTNGTVGYDFMNEVAAVLHDPAGEAPLARLWSALSGRPSDFGAEEFAARHEILSRSFTAPLEALVARLAAMAQEKIASRDVSAPALRRCLVEVQAHLGVYRTYPDATENNREFLARAFDGAARTCFAGDRTVLHQLGHWLRTPSEIQTRFQHLSAPLAAKAVEDTAFYRYGRLLSRNDVGSDAGCFAMAPAAFHAAMAVRRSRFPHALLATATHDHKRGEDFRARLAVLSEIPDEWAATVMTCMAANAPFRGRVDGAPAPSPGDEAMLYQTIVGAWPNDLTVDDRGALSAFAERVAAWQEKAAREAKLATDWTAPNTAYERAARDFPMRLFAGPNEGLEALARFARRIGAAGALNSLAQLVLKLTVPGVPDFYQGTEFWDLSLVDPDNRRAVDYSPRRAALEAAPDPARCLETWRDGRLKQAAIARVLNARRRLPALFDEGEYIPLAATGPASDNLIAFCRRHGDAVAIVIVPRLASRLLAGDDRLSIVADRWGDTALTLPSGVGGRDCVDVLGKGQSRLAERMKLAGLLRDLPVVLTSAPVAS